MRTRQIDKGAAENPQRDISSPTVMARGGPLLTARLRLRPFEDRDRAPFAAMNADSEVMRFFTSTFTQEESDAHIERYGRQLERDGFSFCVAEERTTGEFLGIIGMQTMYIAVPHLPQPAVELGWRLAARAHGKGYATEGAHAIAGYAFRQLRLAELVAITTPDNLPSRHVMEKLGMRQRTELTFDHPLIPADHPRRQHVLYSLAARDFVAVEGEDESA